MIVVGIFVNVYFVFRKATNFGWPPSSVVSLQTPLFDIHTNVEDARYSPGFLVISWLPILQT